MKTNSISKIPVEEEILSLEKIAMDRWQNGDPYGWIDISDENVIYIDPELDTPIIGINNLRNYYKQFEGRKYQYSEIINPKVINYGNTAVLSYKYHSKVIDSLGETIRETYWNSTEVYFLKSKKWKIIHTHWSYTKGIKPSNNV
jgi:hypothetical protein